MEYRLPLAQQQYNVAQHPDKIWLHQPVDRVWNTYTWGEVDDQARRIATGLLENGLQKGDRVAIIAKNSMEWFVTDLAIMMAGMISVPIYATAGVDTIRHVISHSGSKAIFVGKLDDLESIAEAMPDDILSIAFPYPTTDCKAQWQDWLNTYEPLQELHEAQPDDIFTLVYTSGSTGLPKGVVLTQRNVASSAYNAATIAGSTDQERGMSYLPLAHITERCVVELPSFYNPADVYFVESLDTFIDDLRHAKPTNFLSVPRLWTKFQSQILAKMPNHKLQRLLKIPFIGKMVAKKIRTQLGLQHATRFGSGTAPIAPDVLRWFRGIGINIGEGWGMTETSGLSCGNVPYNPDHLSTIGVTQSCVEMKLSDEGEILIRGEAVFQEYYNNPQATEESFIEGWFRTGDKAKQNADNSWQIIGRVKEQFKTGKGKYVAPVPIESSLGRNTDIEQVCVMGVGRKQPIAIIVLGEGNTKGKDKIQAELEETLQAVNSELESHQTLDHLIVCDEAWSIENGLLTPTLKLKRDKLEERYGHFLTAPLKGKVIWEADVA
jgi:long-subunit acyl-CoA synthetase (AMP-forming)